MTGLQNDPRRARALEWLVSQQRIEPALVSRAEVLAARTGRPVEQTLNQMGAVPDDVLAQAYAETSGCEVWRPDDQPACEPDRFGLQAQFLIDNRLITLVSTSEEVAIAMCDPLDDEAVAGVVFATGKPVRIYAAPLSEFRRAAEILLPTQARPTQAGHDSRLEVEVQRVADVGSESEAARLLASVLETAVSRRASDIHLEPRRHDMRIRLRIDGQLVALQSASADLSNAIAARVKVLSNLNLGERRLPQDGRATFVVEGVSLETRVSVVPTVFGEAIVLRILDRVGINFDPESLGIAPREDELLKTAMRSSHGIFFVAGPTGSGKTTTLYALLNSLATSSKKILSVEDPVEHHFAHVNQVQVAPQIDLTFASALRSFLRQDPDVILVGEVRDRETASVAIQAAMTGHLVLASVHTNDAIRIVPRLLDMGVEPYQLGSSLIGAAAQRLVRRLCVHCRQKRSATPAEQQFCASWLDFTVEEAWSPVGCASCDGSGFRARVAIIEGYLASETFLRGVVNRQSVDQLSAAAAESGYRSMAMDGIEKAISGITTFSEVMAALAA